MVTLARRALLFFLHCVHSSSVCSLRSIVTIQCYTEKGSDLGWVSYKGDNSIVFCLNKLQKYYGEVDLLFSRNLYILLLDLLCSKETFCSILETERALEREMYFWLGRIGVIYFFVKILLVEENSGGTISSDLT